MLWMKICKHIGCCLFLVMVIIRLEPLRQNKHFILYNLCVSYHFCNYSQKFVCKSLQTWKSTLFSFPSITVEIVWHVLVANLNLIFYRYVYRRSADKVYRAYIVGIVSRGRRCAERNKPGIFIKIAPFLQWITNIIKDGTCWHSFKYFVKSNFIY